LYRQSSSTSQLGSDAGGVLWFRAYDGPSADISTSTDTRIVSVSSPLDGTNVSSTTITFSGSYYAKSTDFASSTYDIPPYINLIVTNMSDNSTTTLNNTYFLKQRITQFNQEVFFSTTTTVLNNSRYTWQFTISGTDANTGQTINNRAPGMPNGLNFYQFTTGTFDSTSGISFDLSSCNVLSGFNANDCLYNLIFPNNVTFPLLMSEAKEAYGRAWPIGYITRFLTILSSTTPVQPPYISVELPVGGTLTLNPWDKLMGESSILGQATAQITVAGHTAGSGETLKEITEPYWILICYMALIVFVIRDILKHKT